MLVTLLEILTARRGAVFDAVEPVDCVASPLRIHNMGEAESHQSGWLFFFSLCAIVQAAHTPFFAHQV